MASHGQWIIVALLAVALVWSPEMAFAEAAPNQAAPPGASAQPSAPQPVIAPADQVRGLSCLTGGLLAATGTWAFAEFATAAATGGAALPVVVPLMAAAFVTGCEVGGMSLPAVYALLGGT